MKKKASVVIIGGGVNGLAIAYNLAKLGMKDIIVLEKNYLGSGASGRNAGGVRAQFVLKENIGLAIKSQEIYKELSKELGFNVLFKQGGYLFLAHNDSEDNYLKKNVLVQNSLNVHSRIVYGDEIRKLVPSINTNKILSGSFCKTDGVVVHQAVVWGFAEQAKRLGVDIYQSTEVTSIQKFGRRVCGVHTNKGNIETNLVVNAAGARSRDIAKMIGIDLPNRPYRREMLVTESVKHFLNPMVISLNSGLYVNQTLRGEIVMGASNPSEPSSYRIDSSMDFLKLVTKAFNDLFPNLKDIHILRQWGGLYDISPDFSPILGRVEDLEGFILACGWSGHGLMLSPIIGRLISELIVDNKTSISIEPYNLRRFKEGKLLQEVSLHEHSNEQI